MSPHDNVPPSVETAREPVVDPFIDPVVELVVEPAPAGTLRRLLALPLAGGLAAAAVVALPSLSAPAAASLTEICTGYAGCASEGYGNGGYSAHNRTMYWNMYPGHNCTNYVAYRMVQAGVSDTRPWNGDGNATSWGVYESDITDQNPTVGSVAWFRKGTAGGSSGHVAYVEKVISPTQVVVSEDSWNGDFHWAVLTKDGGYWPNGFIHFIARPSLTSTTAPQIVGTPTVGEPLTLRQGVWSSKGHKTMSQQWLVGGKPVPGATGTTYTPKPGDLNQTITAKVTVTRPGYDPGTATATASAAVARGDLVNETPATFTVSGTGTGIVGETLTAHPGTWSPRPSATVYNWKADGHNFPGNFGPTLTLTDALVGKTITVTETAKKDGYHRTHEDGTGSTGPVLAGVIQVQQPFGGTSDTGATRVGSTLTMTPGTVSPSSATITYSWTRDGQPVDGDGAAYHLTAADYGHQIVGHALVSAPDYTSVRRSFSFGPAGTVSHLHVGAKQHKDGAAVRVHVWAAGPGPAPGTVSVTVGDHTVQATLDQDGLARVVIPGLHPGSRRVEVTYAGTPLIQGTSSKGRLQITKVRGSTRVPHGTVRDSAPQSTQKSAPQSTQKPAQKSTQKSAPEKAQPPVPTSERRHGGDHASAAPTHATHRPAHHEAVSTRAEKRAEHHAEVRAEKRADRRAEKRAEKRAEHRSDKRAKKRADQRAGGQRRTSSRLPKRG